MNLIKKFFEKRKFIKETMELYSIYRTNWSKEYKRKIIERNWKIKLTRLKQENELLKT